METFTFNKEDLQKIEELLKSSNTINNIYEQLYKLEIENKKEQNEYNQLIKLLEEAITFEHKKYNELDYNQCKKIFYLLSSSQNILKHNNTDCILFQKYDDKIARRVMSTISQKMILNENFQKERVELIINTGINIQNKNLFKEMNINQKVEEVIRNDILYIMLSILTEYISNKKYDQYKDELIRLKYYISFINKDIEKYLLVTLFNVSNCIYTNSDMTANLLGISSEQYTSIKEIETELTAILHISKLLEIQDSDYENSQKNIESIIRQCYIRALLSLMNEELIYDLNQKFHNLVNKKDYLKKHPNDRISENAIICCFKSQKYDKPKIRSITFHSPK